MQLINVSFTSHRTTRTGIFAVHGSELLIPEILFIPRRRTMETESFLSKKLKIEVDISHCFLFLFDLEGLLAVKTFS